MHNHVDHRWIKAFLRKTISILLVYSLFFTNTAHAAVGGWDLKNPVAQGASTVYDATKNVLINGKNFIKESSVKITPPASQVAKVLARGAAGYALSVAVEQILGSVDWVLDPANNRIKYTDPSASPNCATPQDCPEYLNLYHNGNYPHLGYFASAAAAAITIYESNGWAAATFHSIRRDNGKEVIVALNVRDKNTGHVYAPGQIEEVVFRVSNPAYDPNAEAEEKYLPLPVVAEKVISNAESGDTNAQVATTDAAADIVAEAEKDDAKARPIASQAEANATTKPADAAEAEKANEATGTSQPNTANPEATDIALEFPLFCNWAPTICEAAQTVISFPQTLTNWWETGKTKSEEWALSISEAWTAAKEWAKNDENEDTDNDPPEIQEIDIGALDTSTFTGVACCPVPIQVPITFGTGGETEISYEPICQLADKWSFVAPLIGFLSGAMILVGVGRKGEDGEI